MALFPPVFWAGTALLKPAVNGAAEITIAHHLPAAGGYARLSWSITWKRNLFLGQCIPDVFFSGMQMAHWWLPALLMCHTMMQLLMLNGSLFVRSTGCAVLHSVALPSPFFGFPPFDFQFETSHDVVTVCRSWVLVWMLFLCSLIWCWTFLDRWEKSWPTAHS